VAVEALGDEGRHTAAEKNGGSLACRKYMYGGTCRGRQRSRRGLRRSSRDRQRRGQSGPSRRCAAEDIGEYLVNNVALHAARSTAVAGVELGGTVGRSSSGSGFGAFFFPFCAAGGRRQTTVGGFHNACKYISI